jgi:hypothetical protein
MDGAARALTNFGFLPGVSLIPGLIIAAIDRAPDGLAKGDSARAPS